MPIGDNMPIQKVKSFIPKKRQMGLIVCQNSF